MQLPQRGQWRDSYRHRHRQNRSGGDRADDSDGSVEDDGERAGAYRPQDGARITAADNFAPDCLQGQHQRGERSDQGEYAGGDGLGRTARSPWPSTTDVTRKIPPDPGGAARRTPVYRCHIAVAAGEAQAGPKVGGTAAEFLPGQRQGCQYPVDAVDVILDDLVGEHANAGNREPDAVYRLPVMGLKPGSLACCPSRG